MDWSTNCLVAPTAMCVVGALAVRFGLRGPSCIGGAIGLTLFYGIALPLLERFEGEYRLTDPRSFFLTLGAFAVASAALGVLAVVWRSRRKLLLMLAAVASLPMAVQAFHFTPIPAWGFAVEGFIPAVVFLAKALCIWVGERVEADTFREFSGAFLSDFPPATVARLINIYDKAPSQHFAGGSFRRPDSSANLAANTFGFFLDQPADLPPLPGCDGLGWPAETLTFDAKLRLPWRGAGAARLDVLIETADALIGVESKRYEPFIQESDRWDPSGNKPEPLASKAYARPVWGERMSGYQRLRDGLIDGSITFRHLDADRLVQNALALRAAVHRSARQGKKPALLYVFAEPEAWPDGEPVAPVDIEAHRAEAARFAEYARGDEVAFHHCSYRELLAYWEQTSSPDVRTHAALVAERFAP